VKVAMGISGQSSQRAGTCGAPAGRLLLTSALAVLALGCANQPDAPADVAKVSNLVVVCLDTVRYDVFSLPETAGLDDDLSASLEDALVFDRGQSPAPWTVPSVASLFTGLYPTQHGGGRFVEEIADLSDTVPAAIRREAETLPQLLSLSGFSTAAFVAHPWFRTGYDLDRGFRSLELRAESESLTQRSLEWLDERSSRRQAAGPDSPFFMYLHFMEAHEAHRKPIEEIDQVVASMSLGVRAAATDMVGGLACADPVGVRCRRFLAYVASVVQLRGQVATLLARLDERELLDDTLVVLFSDHGEEFDEHIEEERVEGLDPRGIYGAGHGHTLYQELLHVPLVIWHPGLAGRRVAAPVSLIDIVPSLIDWLPLSEKHFDGDLPGLPLGSLLAGGEKPARALYSSGIAYGTRQIALFDGRWKRVHLPGPGRARLFDLQSDPSEKEPIEDRQLALALDRLLSRHLSLAAPATGGASPDISPEFLEQLQSLGYLDGAVDASIAPGDDSP